MKISSTGSYLSFGLALCYVIGFVCLFLFFGPLVEGQLSKDERFVFFLNNKLSLQFWYLIIYVLFGILLIQLISILKTHIKRNILNEFGSIVGFIWAAFVIASGFIFTVGVEKVSQLEIDNETTYAIFTTVQIIQDALGGGLELLGGIWVFCIGFMGFSSNIFHKYFNLFSLLLGAVGILTVFPFFYSLGGVFGMLQIGWFIWLGVLLWRNYK